MGTRSIIAVPETERGPEAWKGRYCHWDGYPSGVGKTLIEEVKRLGVGFVRDVIMAETAGWSSIVGHKLDAPPNWEGKNAAGDQVGKAGPQSYTARGEGLPGAGQMHRDSDDDFVGAEYVYILHDDHLEVIPGDGGAFGIGGGNFRKSDSIIVPYSVPDADIERALEGKWRPDEVVPVPRSELLEMRAMIDLWIEATGRGVDE